MLYSIKDENAQSQAQKLKQNEIDPQVTKLNQEKKKRKKNQHTATMDNTRQRHSNLTQEAKMEMKESKTLQNKTQVNNNV